MGEEDSVWRDATVMGMASWRVEVGIVDWTAVTEMLSVDEINRCWGTYNRWRIVKYVVEVFVVFSVLIAHRARLIRMGKEDAIPIDNQVDIPRLVVPKPLANSGRINAVAISVVDLRLVTDPDEMRIRRIKPYGLRTVSAETMIQNGTDQDCRICNRTRGCMSYLV